MSSIETNSMLEIDENNENNENIESQLNETKENKSPCQFHVFFSNS